MPHPPRQVDIGYVGATIARLARLHAELPRGAEVLTGNRAWEAEAVRVRHAPGWLGRGRAGGGGGGTGTGMAAVPVTPSLVAVIVAEPVATPITRRLPFAVATGVLL